MIGVREDKWEERAEALGYDLKKQFVRADIMATGMYEQISWRSPHGFHVKAKPTQQLAAYFRP